MSRIVVEFGSEELDFDLADEAVVGSWRGPKGLSPAEAESALREALERPRGYPPLRRNVAPGDRVTIAFGVGLPDPGRILTVLTEILAGSGVAPNDITVMAPPGVDWGATGATIVEHDPSNREELAYLATTTGERRVYLNQALTDADGVLPVGQLGYDPRVGRQGPWNVLFPGLSDAPALEASRANPLEEPPPSRGPREFSSEAFEIGSLLGAYFQIGVIRGVGGPLEFVAGKAEDVRDQGAEAVDRAWRFQVENQAEVVVAGIGGPDSPTSIDELAEGLATAGRLVRRGGRIVALSRAAGPIGPSLQRLAAAGAAGEPPGAPRALSGNESDLDSVAARRLAWVLSRADVYLLSALDPDLVEDLAMIPLARPDAARKLVGAASATFVSRAELTWGEVERKAAHGRRSEG